MSDEPRPAPDEPPPSAAAPADGASRAGVALVILALVVLLAGNLLMNLPRTSSRVFAELRLGGRWNMFARVGQRDTWPLAVGYREIGGGPDEPLVLVDPSRRAEGLLERLVDARERKLLDNVTGIPRNPALQQGYLDHLCRAHAGRVAEVALLGSLVSGDRFVQARQTCGAAP